MAASDTPWGNFSQADYTPEQWKRAALIDTEQGDPSSKDRYKLPVREPSGTVNRNGVHAAAARINQVDGVSADKKAEAARKLVSLYRVELGETPPDGLMSIVDDGERSVSPTIERHYMTQWLKVSPLEVRNSGAKGGIPSNTIGGYASVFEKRSQPLHGGFVEIVERSAFNKSKTEGYPGVVCRYNHNDDFLLGTTNAQTLRLSTDNVGLDYAVDLPQCRSDVYEYVQRGDITNSSFAFMCYDEDWSHDEGYPVRHLTSVKLVDVAPVTTPAYSDATVALRNLAGKIGAPIEEVIELSSQHELRKLFIRTDIDGTPAKHKGISGRMAQLKLMKMRPTDEFGA